MKIITLTIGFLLCISSFGQNNLLNKSATDTKQALDSVITEQYIESTGSRVNESKTEFFYNIYSCDTLNIRFSWDTDNSQWLLMGKINKSYDSFKNLTEVIIYNWDSNTNQYTSIRKNEFVYDTNNNKTEETGFHWDGTLEHFFVYEKYTYNYDSNNNYTGGLTYIWSDTESQIVLHSKSENEYDANNLRILDIGYSWDSNINSWDSTSKDVYQYDINNNCIQRNGYQWLNNAWEENGKTTYKYDGENNELGFAFYYGNSNSWAIEDSTNKSYDNYNNLITSTSRQYMNGDVYNSIKEEFNHNNSYTFSDLILPISFAISGPNNEGYQTNFKNQLLTGFSFGRQNDSNPWVEQEKRTYYYSPQDVNNVNELQKSSFKLYPNPTSGNFNVKVSNTQSISTIKIINTGGQVIKVINTKDQLINIDLKDEPKGLYLIEIISENSVSIHKLVIE